MLNKTTVPNDLCVGVGAFNLEKALVRGLLCDCEFFAKVCLKLYYLLVNMESVRSEFN